jgi:cell division protein FtsN
LTPKPGTGIAYDPVAVYLSGRKARGKAGESTLTTSATAPAASRAALASIIPSTPLMSAHGTRTAAPRAHFGASASRAKPPASSIASTAADGAVADVHMRAVVTTRSRTMRTSLCTSAISGAAAADAAKAVPRPAVTADPLGDLAKNKTGLSTSAAPPDAADPFDYLVQAGAFRTSADADAQKAKLAMLGLDAKVSERDQAGRMVYRVRMGPFSDKNVAERIRVQLEANGIENTLVRVQR